MKANQKLAEIFFEIADILEMQNIQWKPRAYRQAARAIESTPKDLKLIYKKGGLKILKEIPGVGQHIADKIEEYIKTGKIKVYEKLKKTTPVHINILTKIPGMGVKKVKKLNQALKIKTIKQLETAALKHKIAKLPGFGKKSEQEIIEGIALMQKSKGRIPLKQAERIANKIIAKLKPLKATLKISTAGSLKRKKATIGDIDILICSKQPQKIIDTFIKISNQKVLAKGSTKVSLILKSGIQVDLRVVLPKSWGSALLYFIGSKNYNIELRKIAIKKGYKLSEYGLYNKTTGNQVAGRSEKEVLKKLGERYLNPEERER